MCLTPRAAPIQAKSCRRATAASGRRPRAGRGAHEHDPQERDTLHPAPSTGLPQTVADVRDAVREAAARRTPLRIVGLGSWLDGGHPTSPDSRPVNLSALEGITEYTPGDVTLTARAGTPLSTIEAAAASENQWLPLDPFSIADDGGSIGATIATASAGPLAAGLGLPRDVVLGLEAVTGEGAVIRTGGRVVKNVAGFDLTRLLTGAWGTLAILTEVTVRLRGRPVCDETLAVVRRRARVGRGAREADGDGIDDLLQALRAAPAAPIALEVLNRSSATRLELPGGVDGPVALARITGNADAPQSAQRSRRSAMQCRSSHRSGLRSGAPRRVPARAPPFCGGHRTDAPRRDVGARWCRLRAVCRRTRPRIRRPRNRSCRHSESGIRPTRRRDRRRRSALARDRRSR